jgi:hypothetical protein
VKNFCFKEFAIAAVTLGVAVCFVNPVWPKDKSKDESAKVVDSGSFGVFSGGQRIATESFSIKQGATGSVVSSEFKSAQGEQSALQSSELLLAPSSDLRGYEWRQCRKRAQLQ